jgi:hypothetical protein
MSDKPSEHNTLEWDARDQPPTEEQRKKLVRDTLRYASLFPPGPEQSQLRRIARSLTFFEECLHSDEDFANKSTLLSSAFRRRRAGPCRRNLPAVSIVRPSPGASPDAFGSSS